MPHTPAHDTIDPDEVFDPPRVRRPSLLAQAGWGIFDSGLRLVEFFGKLFLFGVAALVGVLVLLGVVVHYLGKGADWLQREADKQEQTTTP